MKLCGVVVLFAPNRENIDGIRSYSVLLDCLIVVDNSEEKVDGVKELETIDNVVYIPLGENKGLGYALNVGCKEAIARNYSYAITMDQDSVLGSDGFAKYVDTILNYKDVALISPQYMIDRKKDIVLQEKTEKIVWTMQSACIFDLSILQKLGFFNEELFIDTIDYEYCLRARKNGFRVLKYYNYAIAHQPAESRYTKIFKIGYGYCSPLRIYYQSRNLRFLKKRFKYWKISLILLMKYVKIKLLFDNKKEFSRMWKQGKRDFKKNRFGKYVGKSDLDQCK